MFDKFEKHITAEGHFSPEELEILRSLATERTVRRKELLLRQGEVCRHKTFVVKGLLRSYLVSEDGTDSIIRFAAENSWTLDPKSYNNAIPSKYNIEALEDSLVLQWSKESMDEVFKKIPRFRDYSDKIKTDRLDASQNRVLVNISYTVEQKYQDFIENYPDIFSRIPLHMVASYLGVSRETLSRVRHAQVKQQK